MNAMRVRLFVDPSQAPEQEKGEGVRQDLEYVKRLGKQIKDAGMKLMLDFHYSDSWADPGKQFTPQDWVALDDGQLAERVHDYTRDVLREMKAYGAEPDFIQTGNEISYGMMWGERGAAEENLLHCWPSSPEATCSTAGPPAPRPTGLVSPVCSSRPRRLAARSVHRPRSYCTWSVCPLASKKTTKTMPR